MGGRLGDEKWLNYSKSCVIRATVRREANAAWQVVLATTSREGSPTAGQPKPHATASAHGRAETHLRIFRATRRPSAFARGGRRPALTRATLTQLIPRARARAQEVHVSLSRVGTRWLIDDVGRAAI